MSNRLIFCEPSSLVVDASNCNQTVFIHERVVCSLMIGAQYRLYINGVPDAGNPYVVDSSGRLFPGGLTITKTFPITEVRLEFECDDCNACTLTVAIPPLVNPCDCSAVALSATLAANCATGLTYSISDGTGPYKVTIHRGTTLVHSATRPTAGTYNVPGPIGNGTYKLKVEDVYGCVVMQAVNVTGCCGITLSNLQYDCVTKILSGTITAVNASGTYIVEIGTHVFTTGAGNFMESVDLLDGNYTVKATDSVEPLCFDSRLVSVNCGAMDLTITSVCDGTTSGIHLVSPSGGTPPYHAELYVNSPLDGNGCPTGAIYTTTGPIGPSGITVTNPTWNASTVVYVVLVDSLGRRTCFPGQVMLDCSVYGFNFTTEFKCVGTQKQVCVRPDSVGTYNISIGGGPTFSDTFSANQQKCYNTALPNGSYLVVMEKGGNSVTKHVTVTSCIDYTLSYDCVTGLSIFEDGSPWTGLIRVDGTPNPSYWNYTGPGTVFLADTTPNHVVNLYTAGGVLITTLTVTNINCCDISLTGVTAVCNVGSNDGVIKFNIVNLVNPLGTHKVEIFDASSNLVESTPAFAGTSYTSGTLANGSYTVSVTDNSYNTPNLGIGSGFVCRAVASATLNCNACLINVSATLTNSMRCPNIPDPTRLRLNILNTNSFSVNYEVYRNDVTLPGACLPASDPPPGTLVSSGTLNVSAGACHDYANNVPGTIPCFYVKFVKVSDPTCKLVRFVQIAN